jgi:hypothetical protein
MIAASSAYTQQYIQLHCFADAKDDVCRSAEREGHGAPERKRGKEVLLTRTHAHHIERLGKEADHVRRCKS